MHFVTPTRCTSLPDVVVELDTPRAPDFTRYRKAAARLRSTGVTHVTIADNSLSHARVSNVAAAFVLKNEFGLEPIVHLNCRDRNLLAQQSTVFGLIALGIRHFLLISGDALALGDNPSGKAVFETDSLGLMERFQRLEAGVDFFGRTLDEPLDVCYGGAINLGRRSPAHLQRMQAKIARGARYFFSQPVFAEEDLLRLAEAQDKVGQTAAVYVGMMPLISAASARFLSRVPGVFVPERVIRSLEPFEGEAAITAGLAYAESLVQTAMAYGLRRFYLITPFLRASTTAHLVRRIREAMSRTDRAHGPGRMGRSFDSDVKSAHMT